jgi:phthiodiolone/phenolphthiodiolone dimycocerosates ketoreductase
MTLTQEDLDFIKTYEPDLPLCGGIGSEIWRPAGFEQSVRHVQILEKLGYPNWGFTEQTQSWTFRSMWGLLPDSQYVPDYEAFYDTTCLIAAAGLQTSKIRLSLTTDCYRRPPSIMAQTLKTLDQITQGRVGLLVGTGENKQFVPHGLERTLPRLERLEEYVRIVKALLRTTDPVTIEGKFWPQKDALLACPIYNPEAPPPVIVVGGGPTTMRLVGRVADGLSSYLPGAYANIPEAMAQELAIMRQEAERVGRDPNSIPVGAGNTLVLCENDSEVTRALDSPYIRGSVLNLTPTGAHWKKWGGQHPLGDKYALSTTHRSTNFSRAELKEVFKKITEKDIQQMIYVGSPEDVASRMLPWAKVMGHQQVALGYVLDFGTTVFPEHRELADDGLPRWHHLQQRFVNELNRLLAAA